MERTAIRTRLKKHLNGGEAYGDADQFVAEITWDKLGERPHGLPYSFYEVFYHMVFTLKDILDFCTADTYETPKWPDDYWPDVQKPETEKEWHGLVENYKATRKELTAHLLDEGNNLMQPVKNGKDQQTLLREVMLVIEHNAYHTGQLVIILRLLNLH